MEKDLQYYLDLPYTILLEQEDNDGSMCYVARLLELPDCIGVGKTTEEAFKNSNCIKKWPSRGIMKTVFLFPNP
jgi:hypothetical protein